MSQSVRNIGSSPKCVDNFPSVRPGKDVSAVKRFLSRAPLVVGCAMVLLASAGYAQVNDHLKCYKIKDPLKLTGVVDIHSPQFGLEKGCKIRGSELFCVPATKRVIRAFNDKQPIDPLEVFGPPAPGDRICYSLQCDNPKITNQKVTDQFGSRVISKLDPQLLCTPAFKGGPPPTNCSDTFPQCGGECPVGEVCTSTPLGCDCAPIVKQCGESAPQCDGACPTGLICRISATGCDCVPPPTECGNATAPTCDGVCPPGRICRGTAASGCTCVEPPKDCGSSAPECGGICPPNEICRKTATGGCNCVPTPTECGTSAPACNGLCPPGQSCTTFTNADGTIACDCKPVPQPCGLQTDNTCSGVCPSPQTCITVADPNVPCRCESPPSTCGRLPDTNICGGDCPTGQTCTGAPPDTECACR